MGAFSENTRYRPLYFPDSSGTADTTRERITTFRIDQYEKENRGADSLVVFLQKFQQNQHIQMFINCSDRMYPEQILPEFEKFDLKKIGLAIRVLDKNMTQNLSVRDKFSMLVTMLWQDYMAKAKDTQNVAPTPAAEIFTTIFGIGDVELEHHQQHAKNLGERWNRFTGIVETINSKKADNDDFEKFFGEFEYWVMKKLDDPSYDTFTWEQIALMAQNEGFNARRDSMPTLVSTLKWKKDQLIKFGVLRKKRGQREALRIESYQTQMLKYMSEGITDAYELAELLGVSVRTINNWKGQLGLSLPLKGRVSEGNSKLIAEINSIIPKLQGQKVTNRLLAETLQSRGLYTDIPIEDLLRKIKIILERSHDKVSMAPRRKPNLSGEQQNEIDRLLESGMTPTQIAAEMQLDPGTVRYYLREKNKKDSNHS